MPSISHPSGYQLHSSEVLMKRHFTSYPPLAAQLVVSCAMFWSAVSRPGPLHPPTRADNLLSNSKFPQGRSERLDAPKLNSARPGSKTPHLPTLATSGPLGSAGALEMAARACSAPLGRSKWPLEPARLRWAGRNGRSNSLDGPKALKFA